MKFKIRCWWHLVAGFIAGFCGAWSWAVPIAGTMAFVSYEIVQDWETGTVSHLDIQEYCIALFIGFVAMIPLKILRIA